MTVIVVPGTGWQEGRHLVVDLTEPAAGISIKGSHSTPGAAVKHAEQVSAGVAIEKQELPADIAKLLHLLD